MRTLIASLLIVVASSVSGQQRPPVDTAGASHAVLGRFAGDWEALGRLWRSSDPSVPPIEGNIRFSAAMVMDGRFLVERMTSQPPSRPFEQVRVIGYDNLTRRYEAAIYDSRGTNIIRATGELTPAGDLVLRYSYTDLGTRASVTRRTVRKLISASEWIETAYETTGRLERKATEIQAHKKP